MNPNYELHVCVCGDPECSAQYVVTDPHEVTINATHYPTATGDVADLEFTWHEPIKSALQIRGHWTMELPRKSVGCVHVSWPTVQSLMRWRAQLWEANKLEKH